MSRGVPIYRDGALFAESMCAAARLLGCTHAALYAHIVDYCDGYTLVSMPSYQGQRGGRRECGAFARRAEPKES